MCAAGHIIRLPLCMIAKKCLDLFFYLLPASGLAPLEVKLAEIIGLKRLQKSD